LALVFLSAQNNFSAASGTTADLICPGEIPKELITLEEQQRQADFETLYRAAMQQKIADGTMNLKSQQQIHTIPVVVHIIHDGQDVGTVQNPDEATVRGYIDEANAHFSHTQPGAPFSYTNPNYGIDTEIQFCLASTDPDGNYTNGIVRHYSPEYYSVDYIKTARYAERVVWDNTQYLNIFINYTTNVLGIHIGANGVVIRNSGFNGTFFCHEVGHWLGLKHTFEGGCINNDCLTDGDKICDTPPKTSSGGSCGGQNNCTADENDTSTNNPYRSISLGGMGDQPDMIENYMDYTQTCWSTFTQGQKNRMRFYHETYQTGFPTSIGCNPQSKPNLDASINIGMILDIPCGQNSGAPIFAMENSGATTLTSVDIEIYLNGNLFRTDNWTGSLPAGDIEMMELDAITFENGYTNLEIRLTNPNGQTDAIPSNSSIFRNVHAVQGGVELELAIVFDGFTYLNSWQFLDANGNILGEKERLNVDFDSQTTLCGDPGSCYTLIMNDNYAAVNDYSLTQSDGTVLVTGDGVTSSQSDYFCINDPCSGNGGDADNDGFCANVDCNDNNFYEGAPQAPGTACDDGNIATENDVIQADNCTCLGTLICSGYQQKSFGESPLTHVGSGSSSTSVSFNELRSDISFQITNINSVTGGNPSSRYTEEVTVSYRNAAGNLITFGTYSSVSQASVEIPGPATEIIVSLADAYDGSSSTTMSVTLSTVGSCDSTGDPCANNGGDADGDGICANVDCNDNNANIGGAGTACNDGDACTTGDVYDSNCNCVGTFQDTDNDGVCDANDICPGGDDTADSDGDGIPDFCDSACDVGAACNDGDACTTGDVYDSNCNCTGTFQDADNDNVCDANDACPNFNDSLIGTSCDDGDPNTTNDTWGSDCTCTGTPAGACTITTISSGGQVQSSNGSQNCRTFDFDGEYQDISFALSNVNTKVNGKPATRYSDLVTIQYVSGGNTQTHATYTSNSTVDIVGSTTAIIVCIEDNDGQLGASVRADVGTITSCVEGDGGNPPNCTVGAACDDGDACTTGDVYDANCICAGTYTDADGDGVCIGDDSNDNDPCVPNTCGGNGCTVYNSESFETDWGIWNNGGNDVGTDAVYANTGTYCVRLRDDSGQASSIYTDMLDLSTYVSLDISFSFFASSMETGEDFFLEMSTNGGSSYTTIQSWVSGTDFINGTRYDETVSVSGLSSTTVFRIRCDASANNDRVYIDDVVIEDCSGEGKLETVIEAVNIFPNPSHNHINVDLSQIIQTLDMDNIEVNIFSLNGKRVYQNDMQVTDILHLNIDGLSSSQMYLLHLRTDDGRIFRGKFVKF